MNIANTAKGAGSGALSMAPTLNPWLIGGGAVLGAIGSGISADEEAKQKEKELELQKQQLDWQRQYGSRQLGQNAIQGMRSNFKEALYRSLTRQ